MWLNRRVAGFLLSITAGCFGTLYAGEVCPVTQGHALRYVDIFDGTPDEKAMLKADKATERKGYWDLAYVYKQGRSVTVRCKYTDGKIEEVRLLEKVARCSYTISKTVLRLTCR